jgi:hypothetical protein
MACAQTNIGAPTIDNPLQNCSHTIGMPPHNSGRHRNIGSGSPMGFADSVAEPIPREYPFTNHAKESYVLRHLLYLTTLHFY